MVWTIEFTPGAEKALGKLDKPIAKRITHFLLQRVAHMDEPRHLATQLTGTEYDGLWRFRIGDYRILARIEDQTILILVTDIDHRRQVYKR